VKNKIKDLSNEIQEENINKFIDEFDKAMAKENKNIIKKMLILLGIIALSFGLIFIINNPIGFIVVFLIISTGVIKLTLNQHNNKNLSKSNIVEFQKEQTVKEILEKGIDENISKHYKAYYKKIINKPIYSYNPKNYKIKNIKVLKKEEKNTNEKYDPKKMIISKKEVINRLSEEVDVFYRVYNLGKYEITNKEWDNLFSEVYKFCFKNNLQEYYYDIMSNIVRKGLAKTLVNNSSSITIIDILDKLSYIEETYGIKKIEILTLKKDIIKKTSEEKNISKNRH